MADYLLNIDEVVGQIVPNVYISRITVDNNAGFAQGAFQQNPHIDPPAGSNLIEGQRTTNEQLSVTLNLTIKDITGNSLSKWFSTPNTSITSKFTGQAKTLKDYVVVHVVRATAINAINEWAKVSSNPAIILSSLRTMPGVSSTSFSLNDFPVNETDATTHYKEMDAAGNAMRVVTKTVLDSDFSSPITNDTRNLAYFVWSEFDMRQLARDFNFDGSRIPELQAMATSWLPKPSKINSDVVFKNGEIVKTGYVFFEGTVNPGDNKVAKTNKLWTGPYHYVKHFVYDNGTKRYTGWKGGAAHNPSAPREQQPFLFRQTVPNTTIQDFRIVDRLEKLDLSFAKLENKLMRIVSKNPRNVINDAKFSYFTDLFLSRDKNNNCRFMFGIDLKKMVRENSVYGGLFNNPEWLQKAMASVRIASMKIYRRRTEGSPEIGSKAFNFPSNQAFDPMTKLKDFDNALRRTDRVFRDAQGTQTQTSYNPSDEWIISAHELRDGTNDPVFMNDYKPDGQSSIRNINNLHGAPDQTYYYAGTDAGMKNLTDGYYQYKIDLEIEDNTVDWLVQQRNDVAKSILALHQYFNVGSQTGKKHASRDAQGKQIIESSNFDPILNRFTEAFIKNLDNGWNSSQSATVTFGAKEVPQKYVDHLCMFTRLEPSDKNDIRDMLTNYTNPENGNLQGCLVLLRLLQDLMSTYNKAIGVQLEIPVPLPSDAGEAMNSTGQSANVFETNIEKQGTPKVRTFTMSHTFSAYYNANLPRRSGYDFLGTGMNGIDEIPTEPGIRKVSQDDFVNTIVPNEIQKVFKNPQVVVNMPGLNNRGLTNLNNTLQFTDFSYFTPAIVLNGINKGSYNTIANAAGATANTPTSQMMATIVDASADAAGSVSGNSLVEQTADFLSYNYNLTAIPQPNVSSPIYEPGSIPPDNSQAEPIDEYNNTETAQNSSNNKAFDIFWDLISSGMIAPGTRGGVIPSEPFGQKSVSYYNASSETGFYNQSLTSEKINALPNQIKALIYHSDTNSSLTLQFSQPLKDEIDNFLSAEPFRSPTEKAKASILFDTIGEIEVLTGFGDVKYGTEQKELQISQRGSRGNYDFAFNPTDLANMEITEKALARPQWQRLTRQLYNAANGSILLCRIKAWESPEFKVKRRDGINLPTYEEYFLLDAGAVPAATNRRNPPRIDTPISSRGPTTVETIMSEVDFMTDPRSDYISSTWDAANPNNNLGNNPPPGLSGDAPSQPGSDLGGVQTQQNESRSSQAGMNINPLEGYGE